MATRRRRKRAVSVVIPKRRKRRAVAAKRRRRVVSVAAPRRSRRYKANPSYSRRRRHSRRYRHNPSMLPSGGFLKDAMFVTGGFVLTRVTYGMVAPMLGGMLPMEQPLVRIAGKSAVAFGLGWIGKRFLDARAGQLLMVGGMVEALNDAVKTFVAPYIPALADDMSVYPQIEVYPGLGSYDSPQTMNTYNKTV